MALANVVGMPARRLAALLAERGVATPAIAAALFSAVHRGGITSLSDFDVTDARRSALAQHLRIELPAVEAESPASDGTTKFVFAFAGDVANAASGRAEAVYIPEIGAGRSRGVVCVSSQMGCSLACSFCATGASKLQRSLTSAEIVGQLLAVQRWARGPHQPLFVDAARTAAAVEAAWAAFPQCVPASVTAAAPLPIPRDLVGRLRSAHGVTNVVFMGQGEPLLTWRSVSAAAQIMTDTMGPALAPRRVTISTSGVAPLIPRVASELGVSLALSLHAPTDELRSTLVPLNRTYPIAALLAACHEYAFAPFVGAAPASPSPAAPVASPPTISESREPVARSPAALERGARRRQPRRMMWQYTLLDGVNDSDVHADQLANVVRDYGLPVLINLIPFNPWLGARYQRPAAARIQAFADVLWRRGVRSTVRLSHGDEVSGACGQLVNAVVRPQAQAAASL